ncbi:hypothetical protein AMJ49_03110 [Parcubacteria bacterium DG_74_2]|nr:MAG: hypothetical protein AMJ49_03110 [Parcubacteria bacterium DG_74_2]
MKNKLKQLLEKIRSIKIFKRIYRKFLRFLYAMWPYRKATIREWIIFVDLRDPRGRAIYKRKTYTPDTGELVPKLWRASFVLYPSYFLDIGANYGEVSLTTKYPENTKKIYLIEPNPNIARALQKSVYCHPNNKKIELISKAASIIDDKKIVLNVPETSTGLGSIISTIPKKLYSEIEQEQFEVSTITLDTLLSNLNSQLTVLKIDVEGSEVDVLKGAERFIAKNKYLILLEISTVYLEVLGVSPALAFEFFNSLGWLYLPDEKRREFIPLKNLDYSKIWSTFLERGLLSDYYKPKDSIIGDFVLFSNNFNGNEIEKYLKSVY